MSSSRLVPTIPSLALVATLIVALAFIGLHFYLSQPQPVLIDPSSSGEAYTTYQDDKFGVSFAYPKNWGTVIALPGNRNLEAGPNCSANGPAFEGGACVGLCLSDERLTFSAKQIPGQEQIGSSSAA